MGSRDPFTESKPGSFTPGGSRSRASPVSQAWGDGPGGDGKIPRFVGSMVQFPKSQHKEKSDGRWQEDASLAAVHMLQIFICSFLG